MPSIKSEIFVFLKNHGGRGTNPEFYAHIQKKMVEKGVQFMHFGKGIDIAGLNPALTEALDDAVRMGQLTIQERDGITFYVIHHWLGRPMSDEERTRKIGLVDYNRIRPSTAGPAPGPKQTGIYKSPLLKYLPLMNQSERGTCVGHAWAYMMSANYYRCMLKQGILDGIPADSEMVMKSDQTILIGCPNNAPMIFDMFWKGIMSPQWMYHASRVIGKITYPEGSYVEAGAKAAVQVGAVPWNECLTAKTNFCAPTMYPFHGSGDAWEQQTWDYLVSVGTDHKLDGTANCLDFYTFMRAIAESDGRGVVIAINLPEGWQRLDMDDCIPVNEGSPIEGSHALWFNEVNWDKEIAYCRNSWGPQFPRMGINLRYFAVHAGPGVACIDEHELPIVTNQYSNCTFQARNKDTGAEIPAVFTINGETRPEHGKFTVRLERNKTYTVTCIPVQADKYKEGQQTRTITPKVEDEPFVPFDFTESGGSPPPKPPFDIGAFIAALFERIWHILNKK
jgi:hypothetical protein